MAKKRRGVNVSEAIRAFIAENPAMGPTEAAKTISEQIGKKVPPSYVSNIKGAAKGKKKGRPGRKPGRKLAVAGTETHGKAANGSVDLASLESFMSLVRSMGKDTAKRLMDLLD